MQSLKSILDKFYSEYDFKERMLHDPIEFPHRYSNARDIEVAGFIASCLAYGRVDLFKSVIGKILSVMGSSPHDFILNTDMRKSYSLFAGIKYRFNENEDIICMLFILQKLLKKYGSIETAFKKSFSDQDLNIEKGLAGLMNLIFATDTSKVYGKNIKPSGLRQFFPSPEGGSSCKRLNLFLRWMIRDRDIDFGIWKGIPKKRLIIPLDTHISKISRCLQLTERRSQDWKMAVEITEALKKFDSEDPLKYDFALCHHGISGVCKGIREKSGCKECVFNVL